MDNKAKIATPATFSKGANTALGATNTKVDTTPTNTLGANPNNFRNLRGASRTYVGDRAPSIPTNGSVGKPPR